jgi:hypothetical protein
MAGCPKCITIGFETTECLTDPPRQVYSLRFGHATTPRRTLPGNTGSLIGRRLDRTHVYNLPGRPTRWIDASADLNAGLALTSACARCAKKGLGVARSLDAKRSLRNMWDTG